MGRRQEGETRARGEEGSVNCYNTRSGAGRVLLLRPFDFLVKRRVDGAVRRGLACIWRTRKWARRACTLQRSQFPRKNVTVQSGVGFSLVFPQHRCCSKSIERLQRLHSNVVVRCTKNPRASEQSRTRMEFGGPLVHKAGRVDASMLTKLAGPRQM